MLDHRALAIAAVAALWLVPGAAGAQTPRAAAPANGMVQLDFNDVELTVVIDTISRLTGKNFIYDDRVRGRVTIVSPTPMTLDQAYAVFESVLQVKGFTTVEGPGGAIKVIPIREAKESSIETLQSNQPPPFRDRYVTRLIPLRYIDAEAITNTLKPLVSKDAALAAYPPTNTVIVTDSASNIRRLLSILEAIDIETYKEELAVLKLRHADAATIAGQLTEIYGGEVASRTSTSARRSTRARRTTTTPRVDVDAASALRARVRIITDERTNSLVVLASRSELADIRELLAKLDIPVTGGGRIHVYYLKHADAEELAQTLSSLLTGQPGGGGPGGGPGVTPQALRATVTALAEGVSVTADPATNSLVIQSSQEAFATLTQVIEKLDIPRPQVLVEALIMEVNVTNSKSLGFNGVMTLVHGGTEVLIGAITDGVTTGLLGVPLSDIAGGIINPDEGDTAPPSFGNLPSTFLGNVSHTDDDGTFIQGVIRAAASNGDTNIISAPHILTSDNEEAEIRIGANIPIITTRVQSGVTESLSTSVNVERQDIGVTLRVTPQISADDSLRLKIYQEITNVDPALSLGVAGGDAANVTEVGVSLTSRQIENTVVVADGATVVIGGLLSDSYSDTVNKIPFLGDIPVLGWAFKTKSKSLTKINLLVFLTPHIIRGPDDLEHASIRKREQFWNSAKGTLEPTDEEEEAETTALDRQALEAGLSFGSGNPVRTALLGHRARYPLERMAEIEQGRADRRRRQQEEEEAALHAPLYAVLAGVYEDAEVAADVLTDLLDLGFDGALISGASGGAVLHEIQLGPYETLDEARHVSSVIAGSLGLSPSVLVRPREEEP